MDAKDIELLANPEIPEIVREKIAEEVLNARDRAADRDLETQRLQAERTKFLWNTPVVAALAGLLTLSATFLFDRVTARDTTANTITLEQVRTEFEQSEARLKQELDAASSENLARLEAQAREREFQYEIVRSELTQSDKSNQERAAVLLFLVRAGVLNTLNEDELRRMAEAQIESPNANIIPQLAAVRGVVGVDDSLPIAEFDARSPVAKLARSVGLLRGISRDYADSVCTAFLISDHEIATARACLSPAYPKMQFELFSESIVDDRAEVYEIREEATRIVSDDGGDGYAVLTLERPVDAVIGPLRLAAGSEKPGAKLGVIYIRQGEDMRAIWGPDECHVLQWEPHTILHLCDTGPGTNGAPLFEFESRAVVGIHSHRSEAGGVAIRVVP